MSHELQFHSKLNEKVVVSKMEMTTEYGAFNKAQRIACDFDAVVKAIGKKGGEA